MGRRVPDARFIVKEAGWNNPAYAPMTFNVSNA
jgi:hypothetical protein